MLDFSSEISSIIAEKLHLPHASTESIYKAQNKALFGTFMKTAGVPYPQTTAFDISQDFIPEHYPVFIRPVRGSFSAGAYMIESQEDYKHAQEATLADNSLVPSGFEDFLLQYDPTLKPVRNRYIAQPYLDYQQYVVDGFVHEKEVSIFGITKDIYTEDRKSFFRYDFPITFTSELLQKLQTILENMMHTIDYDNSGFNVEFFLTPENEIIVIELNTRITPGFLHLFEQQYHPSPFEWMIQLSLGKKPEIVKETKHAMASGFPLRLPYDCLVTSVPNPEELGEIKKNFDILHFYVIPKVNTKLSEYRQDAYSFCYGRVDIAGDDAEDIERKYTHFLNNLPLTFKKL